VSPSKTKLADCGTLSLDMCDHLFQTTTRYDRVRKVLTFVLFCPTCPGVEQVVEMLPYEPVFKPDLRVGPIAPGRS